MRGVGEAPGEPVRGEGNRGELEKGRRANGEGVYI